MKDYEETFKHVLEKINKYEDVKKSKKEIVIKWVVSICCVCAIAMIGIGVWKSGLIRISRFNPSDDQDSGLQETTEPAFQVVKKRPDAPIIWAEDLPYGPEYKDWNVLFPSIHQIFYTYLLELHFLEYYTLQHKLPYTLNKNTYVHL